ncbi:hypothetical protein WISP_33853 [Willisornis vidua]|uniref:Uncharacterized protein n=1 Tax=Willisornis vidua TaxID=1566151 RepID=A0ABQ9DQH8_9PASS|nr:hypothetical protein WISP_33853 [Willisornis vidua]
MRMIRGLENLSFENSLEKRRLWGVLEQHPVPKGACKKDGETLFARAWSDRTSGNGFKPEEIWIKDEEGLLYCKDGEKWEDVAQSSCGCTIPGSVKARLE